jgi:ornithine cyclodeaminase
MINYFNEKDVKLLFTTWKDSISTIKNVIRQNDYVQPIKPYLRYNDMDNRIIAMPAYVGGSYNMAGIKWIASFPKNIEKGIPRAHSIIILNKAETGEPKAIFNTPLVSIIRTVSVSGVLIEKYMNERNTTNVNVGIIGFGPIGQNHAKMVKEIVGSKLNNLYVYDIRNDIETDINGITFTKSWVDFYNDVDILITCTVSNKPYIDKVPPKGQLFLNVSLRDIVPMQSILDSFDTIIVDDWDEVNRENTDIENFYKKCGLAESDVSTIFDLDKLNFSEMNTIHFSPMGMGVFDIAISTKFFQYSQKSYYKGFKIE